MHVFFITKPAVNLMRVSSLHLHFQFAYIDGAVSTSALFVFRNVGGGSALSSHFDGVHVTSPVGNFCIFPHVSVYAPPL